MKTTAKKVLKETISLVAYLAIVAAITFVTIRVVGQRTIVEGESMEPCLYDGDNLVVDRISYFFYSPKRFDVVVFPFRDGEDLYYIKRIIGLPGETVSINDAGEIYIDGERLVEIYGREVIQNPGIAKDEITLGEEEYFVLGDNRNNSLDSRDERMGVVTLDEIEGRAWLRIYPLDKFGMIKQQYD